MKYDFSKIVMKGGKIVQVRGGALVPMDNGEGPEPEPIVLPANTFRFQWEKPIDNPPIVPARVPPGVDVTQFKLSQVDDRTWDYTIVELSKSMSIFNDMFWDLENKVKLIAVGDISDITNMAGLFSNCSAITSIPLFDTSHVTNMAGMFMNCILLTSVPLFDTSKVTNMNNMFRQCDSLIKVPLFDTSNVTDMQEMFSQCTSLTKVPQFDVSNVTSMYYMFYNCTKVESGALALYQQAVNTGKVTEHDSAFTNCGVDTESGHAELQQIPQSWGGQLAEG